MLKILLVICSYLLGSIPTGWIVTKIVKNEDIRDSGSGATGATNVYRRAGYFWAGFVMLFDIFKAFLPTYIAVKRWPDDTPLHVATGAAATIGHTRPIFLKEKGGKAVSTTAGAFFALATKEKRLWLVFQLASGTFFGAIAASKGIVSLGSVTGVISGAFYTLRLSIMGKISKWYGAGIIAAAVYIVYMHRENLSRIKSGEEKTIKFW